MNEDNLFNWERVRFGKQTRFNPLRTLTPENLVFNMDQFNYGYLRWTALLWEQMEKRDDVLMSVAPKRKKAPGRRPWKIMTRDDSPAALDQKQKLEYAYKNLRVTNCVDRNVTGGLRQLTKQMLDCHSKYYSAHHIVWRPNSRGLTAEIEFVPLWYFENLTGELKFLLQDFDVEGVPLNPSEWIIATGDGLMEVCSVAYIFKHLPLKDWLIYSQRHGMPGVHGKTGAAPGTDAWQRMTEAVSSMGQNWSCVTSKDDTIEKLDFSAQGNLPYAPLIERVDRAISALWRGADLSTMSGHGSSHGGGQGASLQGQESELLEADDCELISETLQQQFDKWVIFYTCGTFEQLAYFTIEKPVDKDTDQDIAVDTFLLSAGFPLAQQDAADRYDRRIPEDDEETLIAPQQALQPDPSDTQGASNARAFNAEPLPGNLRAFIAKFKKRITAANATSWRPIVERLEEIDRATNEDFYPMLEQLQADIPGLLKPTGADETAINAWQNGIGTMLANGLAAKN